MYHEPEEELESTSSETESTIYQGNNSTESLQLNSETNVLEANEYLETHQNPTKEKSDDNSSIELVIDDYDSNKKEVLQRNQANSKNILKFLNGTKETNKGWLKEGKLNEPSNEIELTFDQQWERFNTLLILVAFMLTFHILTFIGINWKAYFRSFKVIEKEADESIQQTWKGTLLFD